MANSSKQTRFQAQYHALVSHDNSSSLSDYCLHLMRFKGYEQAASMAARKNFLDVGYNNGYGVRSYAKPVRRVVALDVSLNAINDAPSRFCNRGIDFLLYDSQRMPFDNHSFDLVTSFQVALLNFEWLTRHPRTRCSPPSRSGVPITGA
jgi:ubiquinone/menaquinone biosynthesis C-methylase UbiE